jgi:hypothetical protein
MVKSVYPLELVRDFNRQEYANFCNDFFQKYGDRLISYDPADKVMMAGGDAFRLVHLKGNELIDYPNGQ